MKLLGSNKIKTLTSFNNIKIIQPPILQHEDKKNKLFVKTHDFSTFLETQLEAFDRFAAVIEAQKLFIKSIDILRFDYVPDSLCIYDHFYVIEKYKNTGKVIQYENKVPNPIESITEKDLESFKK